MQLWLGSWWGSVAGLESRCCARAGRWSGRVSAALCPERGEEAAPWGPAFQGAIRPSRDIARAPRLGSHSQPRASPRAPKLEGQRAAEAMPSAETAPSCPPGVSSASRLLCFLPGRSACMVLRFEGASLLTKGKFEIPFLEKNVPPSSRPLWPQGQNLVGIQVGSHIENPF